MQMAMDDFEETAFNPFDNNNAGLSLEDDSDSDEDNPDPMAYEVESVFNSRLHNVKEPCTREYHVKWSDGSTTWEPRDSFVDPDTGLICSALIQYELNRTKEEHKHALADTLRVDYCYTPSDIHTLIKHDDGVTTVTTAENDTLNKIASLFPNDDTITPYTLLEMNVWYLSSVLSDNRFHVGDTTSGLTVTSKLRRHTVLRLPLVASQHHVSSALPSRPNSVLSSVQVDFAIDYRHRNYSNAKASPETNKEVKDLCLYFAVSKFERTKGIPSDKCIENGSAVTFTTDHPMCETHYWRRHKIATIPLLFGTRLPSTSKLGVSQVNHHLKSSPYHIQLQFQF
jgi:hypothetical protein